MSDTSDRWTRRDLLNGVLAALAVSPASVAEAKSGFYGLQGEWDVDPQVQQFWNDLGKTRKDRQDLSGDHSATKRGSKPVMTDPGRAPIFFFATDPSDSTTWQRANKVDRSRLLSADSAKNPKGDVTLQLRVNGIKLSNSDQNLFGKIENGSLRLDVGQAASFGPSIGDLVWTAIASIWPTTSGKLPPTQNMNFDPGTTWGKVSKTPLPGGNGTLLWNFFVNKKPSVLSRLISTIQGITSSTEVVLPLLGLPGYVVSAFNAFNKIFGAVPQTPTFLFQQSEWEDVVCTQSGLSDNVLTSNSAVRFTKGGQYIVVPTSQAELFLQGIKAQQFSLSSGRIVKATDGVPETAALRYLTDVTYATFTADVEPGLS
jgi:hypothetical protein